MTAVDDRTQAITRDRAALDEDFFTTLLPEAAEHVIVSGLGSAAMLQRKMRLPYTTVSDLMGELEEAGVVGPDRGATTRDVLVPPDGLADALARLADLAGPDQDEPASSAADVVDADVVADPPPLVSLVKPPPDQAGDTWDGEDWDDWDDDDQPGGELELRPRHPLARIQYVTLAPVARTLATRARQATARQIVWVADQPLVSRSLHVGRQVPRATWRLAAATPRGSVRLSTALVDWLRDARSAELLAKHAEAGEGESYAKVARARLDADVAGRNWRVAIAATLLVLLGLAWWAPGVFATVAALAVFVGGTCLAPRGDFKEWLYGLAFATGLAGATWWFGDDLAALIPQPPAWVWWVLGGVALMACAWAGRQEDKPILEKQARVVPHEVPVVTAPMVIGALVALNHSQMKDPELIRVIMDPHKVGDGVQLDFELPGSVTAMDIIEDRAPLAAAMRHELGTVWPSLGPRHPGHLTLYVSRVPMVSAVQAPWPLATGGAVSLFQPLPLFTDQRGQWVYQTLAYTAWVIGAVPRMGKTRALLSLGLVSAKDVRARLYVFDLKGTGDLSSLAKVAHRYRVGDEPEDIADMLEIMRGIRQEMRERTRLVRELSLEENPERGKVTDALADRDPDRFGPIVVLVDEVQVWTQEFTEALPNAYYEGKPPKDPGKAVRDEFTAILRDLVKRGPALGIIPKVATQKPDAKSIPSSIADNASARLCLKVNGQISNDQILGTSSYQAGIRATQFAFSEKGIAYFRGDGAEPLVVRTVTMDAEMADRIADQARALRMAAGRLTGEAADDGIEDAVLVTDIVDDVEQVMRDRNRGRAHHVELVEWLRVLRPEDYSAIDVEEVSARLRARNVKISQVRIEGVNRKGVRLSDLRFCDDEADVA